MQQTIKCANCNAENPGDFSFCATCGTRLGTPCPECGVIMPPDSRYCPNCAALCGSGRFGKAQHKIEATYQTVNCPNCGHPDNTGRRFCTACGARILVPCPSCGAKVEPTAGYCEKCGQIITGGQIR
jgi:hypothetical protein